MRNEYRHTTEGSEREREEEDCGMVRTPLKKIGGWPKKKKKRKEKKITKPTPRTESRLVLCRLSEQIPGSFLFRLSEQIPDTFFADSPNRFQANFELSL